MRDRGSSILFEIYISTKSGQKRLQTTYMKLVIVESPAKAGTIEKYLGDDYSVKSSVGHIRDLPKSNKKAVDIEAGFVPHYEISKGKEKVVKELQGAAKKVDEVILATDLDREGEAIAWHLAEALNLKNPKRIVFNEITKEAIQEAIKHPRGIDTNLRTAQEARRVLDRLFGYDLSGLIWKKVRYGLSAGRVQSPALRILMEREREIRAFKPEKFYVLSGEFETNPPAGGKEKIELVCEEEPKDKKEAERIVKAGKKGMWGVVEVKETNTQRKARAPFTTSTLQQTASSRLGFSPSRTMGIAQKLYEKGFITYMRTDSMNMSAGAQKQILEYVQKEHGKEFAQKNIYRTKSKAAQEAHEAIRPTNILQKNSGQNEDQKKLYRLIWDRAVSSQMSPAKMLKTKISANIKDKSIPNFSITGSRILFLGWLSVDTGARGEDVELPELKKGEPLKLLDLHSEEKETQPPNRYSEAGLVKELEKRGIGRPSTYAPTIKTLVDRGYVEKEGRSLHPTDTGDVVSSFVEDNFTNYISDSFTSEMENKLDEIAAGKREYVKTLKDFYDPFTKEVASKEDIPKLTTLGEADENIKCPTCGSSMVIKLSRNGKFLSCSKYPDCKGARTIEGKELEGPKEIGEKCPKCTKGNLVEREGRFGKFISCDRYPKCKFIRENDEEAKKKRTGVSCPECKKGEMTERRGKYGIFYSCSEYPDCKYAIKAKPTGNICKECGSLMMEGTKTISERCSSKACPMHNPHKLKDKKK